MTSKLKLLVASAVIPAVFLNAVPAMAAGTTQGASVLNNVTVDFQVGGQPQTQQGASDEFLVDRKVLFSIAEKATTGTTTVFPGQTGRVTTFLLTNNSNDVLDFTVTPANIVGGTAAHGGTDVFDVGNLLICLDGPVVDGACDVAATATLNINDLGAEGTATILIVGDIAPNTTNGQVANVSATAVALNSDGSPIDAADDTDTNGKMSVETVFADVAKSGNGGTSAARDGIDVATDDYTVSAAALTVFKSSRIVFDNINGPGTNADPSNPKSVPGATVEYCISVANAAGATTATNISVRDIVPADLTFVPGSIRFDATVGSPGASQTCTVGTTATDATGDDAGEYNAGATRVDGTLSNIAQNTARALIFRATID